MRTLHCVNKVGQPLALCKRSVTPGDVILFIEDGVYALLRESDIPADCSVYAIESDLKARGVKQTLAKPATYEVFVELTAQHEKVVSWF